MYVLSDTETGYSDESMRFGTVAEMTKYLDEHPEQDFTMRIER